MDYHRAFSGTFHGGLPTFIKKMWNFGGFFKGFRAFLIDLDFGGFRKGLRVFQRFGCFFKKVWLVFHLYLEILEKALDYQVADKHVLSLYFELVGMVHSSLRRRE